MEKEIGPMAKRLRTGVNRQSGSGFDLAYEWGVFYLAQAREEAHSLLSEAQYHHVADQFKQMALEAEPTRSPLVDVRPIEDFFELRDKGGPLGKLNLRVFFTIDHNNRAIVVLGTVKKEAEGRTPAGDKLTMRVRKRRYESGEYGKEPARGARRTGRGADRED